MKRYSFLFLLFASVKFLLAQSSNVALLGTWDGASVDYSDLWGFVDNSGNEYAIIGSLTKTHVINVTNPGAPVLVNEFTGGASSAWREYKTYGNYAYGVTDVSGSEGLLILNLSNLPTSVSLVGYFNTDFQRAHNLTIDTQQGRLYIAGSSGGAHPANNGLIVYDLTANPANPVRLASNPLPGGYVHDLYVKNHVAYCSHGNNGLYVYNMSNAANEVILGSLTTYPEQGYNHSGWLNSTGNWYVFADETHGKKMHIADVSDLTDITVGPNNVFRQCLLSPTYNTCIAHNPYIVGDLAFVSYYHDGLQVWDISNPYNVQQVGYYDTYPSNTNYSGYQGAWGCYPFLPSGNILISDISTGLYVLDYTAALPVELVNFRGKYEEGSVKLNWETMSESQNHYFEVQRSSDGVHFSAIAVVDGHGNSNDPHDYGTRDPNPPPGTNYYRLQQVDFDGSRETGKTIAVQIPNATKWKVFPTITSPGYTLFNAVAPENVNNEAVNFQVFTAEGRLVNEQTGALMAGETLTLEIPELQAGTYTAVLTGRTFRTTTRIVCRPD